MASFNKDIEDKISSINADLEDKMGFFDSDSDSCDSEDSFHSISNSNQRDSDSNLLNSSSADSRLQDSSPESKMASESDKFFNSNQFSSRESKNIDNSSSELNEFDERPNLANEESGEPDKVSNFISELNEQCAQGNKIIEDELEFDILCLKSVKNRDEQNETKLQKMCEDLDEEKLKSMREEAAGYRKDGNQLFTSMEYLPAIEKYGEGLEGCPLFYPEDRAMLYHNRAAAYQKMEENKLALYSCARSSELWPTYLKAWVRKAALHQTLDELNEALESHKKVLELEPGNAESRSAVLTLPPLIDERNEKMKEEMMGKLKDLGNLCLRPFGLSTNNFKFDQDPNTGGYSMKFQQ